MRRMSHPQPNAVKSALVSGLLESFHDALRSHNRHTRRAYIADLGALCAWYEATFGMPLTLDALTQDVVLRYRQWCRTRVRAGTFNRRRAALAVFCEWAVHEGLMLSSTVEGVACLKR